MWLEQLLLKKEQWPNLIHMKRPSVIYWTALTCTGERWKPAVPGCLSLGVKISPHNDIRKSTKKRLKTGRQ